MHNQFKLIKDKAQYIAFHTPTSTIIQITEFIFNVINNLQEGCSINEISAKFKLAPDIINNFLDKFYHSIPKKEQQNSLNRIRSIGRITLHISNACNLRCRYCYADGGDYSQEKKIMTEKTANDFVDYFTKRFDVIDNIVFFGGEPLLNPTAIEIICERFIKLKKDNKIKELPTFGIITNGTLIDDNILKILKKYINFITVSIDGNKNINDKNRIFPNNKGSYDKISNFIKIIKTKTNIKIKYEATYTNEHQSGNITRNDIYNYLFNEFEIMGTIATDINIQKDISNSINKRTINLLNDYISDGFINVLGAIVNNTYREMCPVGSNMVSVSVDGEIYPCHMNTGKKNVMLGSIYDDNIFDNRTLFQNKFPYLMQLTKEKEPCSNCWIQRICGGCTVLWFYNNLSDTYNDKPNEELCESNREYIESVIIEIARMKNNKEEWTTFLKILENNRVKACQYESI